jgi:hypothetical protein
MAVTIHRAASALGLTLLNSVCDVGSDGLVTIKARFLEPASGLNRAVFDLDAPWPLPTPPLNMPAIQGGPYLLSVSIAKEAGLNYVDTTYVSAVNPLRILVSEASEKLSFSGSYVRAAATFVLGASATLSFDYYTAAQTFTYTLIAPNIAEPQPAGQIGHRFNVRSEGRSELIVLKEEEIVTTSRERIGLVTRVSVTSRRWLVQDDQAEVNLPGFLGITNQANLWPNPWSFGGSF